MDGSEDTRGPLTIEFLDRARHFSVSLNARRAPSASKILEQVAPHEEVSYHAKRDGQVLFIYEHALAGCPIEAPQTAGEPGDVFIYAGDSDASGREGLPQLMVVYGPANLFVEPFDIGGGLKERSYGFVGRVDHVEDLRLLGDDMWRTGIERVKVGGR